MTTYLYIKEHTLTKLKYFGKTSFQDPFIYLGSGKYWKRHIKKHGKEFVKTLQIFTFEDEDKASQFAINFSKINNIVNSDKWANLAEETAKSGGRRVFSKESRHKMSLSQKGKIVSDKTRKKLSDLRIGRKHSARTKLKISVAKSGKKLIKTTTHKDNLSKAMTGFKSYTNGIDNFKTKDPSQVPIGYYPGMTRKMVRHAGFEPAHFGFEPNTSTDWVNGAY